MNTRIPACCLISALLALEAWALSPAEVQRRLDAGEKITLIDVRSASVYSKGHIPNALNVPASLVPLKGLPPLGAVVVYDEGLGVDVAKEAAAALNQKPGINAEVLEGGFAAWQAARSPTTAAGGVRQEEFPMITYDRLKESPVEDLVLVDLRQGAGTARPLVRGATPPLTDLQAEFPGARTTRSPFDAVARPKAAGASADPPLLVLIDSGDGTAQAMSRALKGNGVTRFVILAGGEEIIARRGQSGLQRAAGSLTVPAPARPPAPQ